MLIIFLVIWTQHCRGQLFRFARLCSNEDKNTNYSTVFQKHFLHMIKRKMSVNEEDQRHWKSTRHDGFCAELFGNEKQNRNGMDACFVRGNFIVSASSVFVASTWPRGSIASYAQFWWNSRTTHVADPVCLLQFQINRF